MKLKVSLLAGLAALGFASSASAQTVINITGATAFRAAAHNSIIAMLGGASTEYGYVGSSIGSANHAVFKGMIGGQPHVIRTSFSGSGAGIRDVAQGNAIVFLKSDLASPDISTTGAQIATAIADATTAGKTENAVPRFSFSDVDQAITEYPTPVLNGEPVGVVPFIFVANVGAPAGFTNMSDQLHEAQWSTGQLPLSMYTGNPADTKLVLNLGRASTSGTRMTILSETQYGPFRSVVQWGGPDDATNVGGAEGGGTVNTLAKVNNGGYGSNSYVRQNLARTSANVTVDGQTGQDVVLVSYLTLSDANAITQPSIGARALTYNGVEFSVDNVKNGSYTLWGYQMFYGPLSPTAAETTFFNGFRNEIPNALTDTTGIKIPEMNVTRSGGDGGLVSPNN